VLATDIQSAQDKTSLIPRRAALWLEALVVRLNQCNRARA